ncbi:MAG: response regulator [Alphaproteobacteria bacterium]
MSSYNFSRIRALIAEDDPNMRTILQMSLGACGLDDIILTTSGGEAFQIIVGTEPDLVITDWRMAGGGGIELVRRIRMAPNSPDPFLPIVMLSGYAHREQVMEARDAGVTDFLVKPISAKNLLTRIIAVIENPRPFISTPDFFGPNRRGKNGADHDGPDNRTIEPAETPIDTLAVSLEKDALLDFADDALPRIFRPPNRLREKLGELDGPEPEFLIARIEAGIAELKDRYISWANADLTALYDALDAARAHLGNRQDHIDQMNEIAHNMRGQAGTFDYPLITEIGSSLCSLVDSSAKFGEDELEAVEVHVQAIHTVIGGKIEGPGDERAREMLAGLAAVSAKLLG